MKADSKFKNQDLEFWANIRLLNQRLGYTVRKSRKNPEGGFLVPTAEQIKAVFEAEGLSTGRLLKLNKPTPPGMLIN